MSLRASGRKGFEELQVDLTRRDFLGSPHSRTLPFLTVDSDPSHSRTLLIFKVLECGHPWIVATLQNLIFLIVDPDPPHSRTLLIFKVLECGHPWIVATLV